MNELMKSYIIPIEAYSFYILYTLANVGEHSYNITIYQHFICAFFILLVIFILLIIYYDTIYKAADNIKRCRDIDLTSKINENLDYPYVYNIYVTHKNDVKNVFKNYIFYIQYDFINKKTIINFGNKINSDIINAYRYNDIEDELHKKAFYYYNLELDYGNPIIYTDELNKLFYFNKDIISGEDYKFIITRYDKTDILNDPSAYELLNFFKKYGFDNEYINLTPIYNIYYAIDNKKNKLSI